MKLGTIVIEDNFYIVTHNFIAYLHMYTCMAFKPVSLDNILHQLQKTATDNASICGGPHLLRHQYKIEECIPKKCQKHHEK